MTCIQAVQTILHHILSAGQAGAAEGPCLEQAVEHVTQCRHCVETLDTFAALMGGQPCELLDKVAQVSACWRCQEKLPAYLDSHRYGGPDTQENADIWAHLQACADCREQYDTLQDMIIAEAKGLLGPLRYAAAGQQEDTASALDSSAPRNGSPLWRELPAEVLKSSRAVVSARVDKVKELLTPLKALVAKNKIVIITPSPGLHSLRLTPALATRHRTARHRTAVPEEAAQLIPLPDEESRLQVNVTLKATDSGHADVTVAVVDLQSALPIKGAPVFLYQRTAGVESMLRACSTNAQGEVHFSLSAEQYVIQVNHTQHVLRFPLGFERST